MSLTSAALSAAEKLPWPDLVLRAAVAMMVNRSRRRLQRAHTFAEQDFARDMARFPIAINTREANDQHYELPPKFFALMLGPQRKYSCCYYDKPGTSLAQAEEQALIETAEHAALADGQRILELGCGWGSLSLWMARRLPAARIISISNSHWQRTYIAACAEREGLRNLSVITADINTFEPQGRFDRVVSVEMFEHMSNWRNLLKRTVSWMTPAGVLFIHIFSHRLVPYRFEVAERTDWIAQHFFTGGIMPSCGLIRQFGDLVNVDREWRWDGTHYQRTALDWLQNFDRNSGEVAREARKIYGADAALWTSRWRLFLHATAGPFGHRKGQEWGVSHYRLKPTR
jgi:cyclopropane-fatty-acyl-phospholipid synthase